MSGFDEFKGKFKVPQERLEEITKCVKETGEVTLKAGELEDLINDTNIRSVMASVLASMKVLQQEYGFKDWKLAKFSELHNVYLDKIIKEAAQGQVSK